jgi:hypothetical protein
MTRISRICVAGGAMVALALSTGSAWAPIYMNTTTTTPKLNLPKVNPPTVQTPKLQGLGNSAVGYPRLDAGSKDAAKLSTPLNPKTYTKSQASGLNRH